MVTAPWIQILIDASHDVAAGFFFLSAFLKQIIWSPISSSNGNARGLWGPEVFAHCINPFCTSNNVISAHQRSPITHRTLRRNKAKGESQRSPKVKRTVYVEEAVCDAELSFSVSSQVKSIPQYKSRRCVVFQRQGFSTLYYVLTLRYQWANQCYSCATKTHGGAVSTGNQSI